ncbi:MAG: ABC transporter ATP-binding protein [Oscillospiraceae bacterium]|nr:ABC transporter ATP-binding protein [Oscillospiraceae bacterium]
MNAIEVKNLCKNWGGFALTDFSLAVKPGEIHGLAGRNGAGKSTALGGMMGLVRADGGEVRFFGQEVDAAREHIGYVPGAAAYYPRKTLKSIAAVSAGFYKNWDKEAYRRYMTRFGLEEGKRVNQLSTGMQVKFALTLALSHRAQVLVLDEPTSGLDPISRREILEILQKLAEQGCAVLFSTHIISDLELCAHSLTCLKAGRVVEQCTLSELRSKYPQYPTLEDAVVELCREVWE